MAIYDKKTWVEKEVIYHEALNHIEQGIYDVSIGNHHVTLYKKSESILIDWETSGNDTIIRFYGSTVDYVGVNERSYGSGLTVGGANITWANGNYIVMNLISATQADIITVATLDEIYANPNYLIMGHMHYVNSEQAAHINGYGTMTFGSTD